MLVHSGKSNFITQYLGLMHDHLDETRTRELYVSYMTRFPKDSTIKNAWARWLHSRNYQDDAENVLKELIAGHPKSFSHWYSYGRLLLDMERYDEAAHQFKQVIRIHSGHAMGHDGLALALQSLARHAEEVCDASEAARLSAAAEREFKSALYWAGVAQDRQAIFFTHLGWFYAGKKRWGDALGAFDQAMNEDPEYFGNHWGRGRALAGLERWRDAARALRTALEKAPDPLGPPASDDIHQLIVRCEAVLATEPQERRVDAV